MGSGKKYTEAEVVESFQRKYDINAITGCWLWVSALTNGYGTFRDGPAHRFSFELHRGPIPDGMQIDHLCRHPRCVRPDHLEIVTPQENTRRGISQKRRREIAAEKTHCSQGHALAPSNTYERSSKNVASKVCRVCARATRKARYHKLAENRERMTVAMLPCPSCGGDTGVLTSRPSKSALLRKRRCRLCALAFFTEQPWDGAEVLRRLVARP
jgi:hypothetical protein